MGGRSSADRGGPDGARSFQCSTVTGGAPTGVDIVGTAAIEACSTRQCDGSHAGSGQQPSSHGTVSCAAACEDESMSWQSLIASMSAAAGLKAAQAAGGHGPSASESASTTRQDTWKSERIIGN
jgi:hypothetical protein